MPTSIFAVLAIGAVVMHRFIVHIDNFAIDDSVAHLLNGGSEESNSVARNAAIVLGEADGIER